MLEDAVAEIFDKYRQKDLKATEAGGILLGRIIEGTGDAVLSSATEPGHDDKRTRSSFHRSRYQAQKVVNVEWKKSEGTVNYMGEWHTHPEDMPSPSSQDRRNWIRISQEATYESDFLLFAIVGNNAVRIWEIEKNNAVIIALACEDG